MPTNQLEELDYKAGSGSLSGERVFGNTVPATSTREQTFNTLWHGLRTLVKSVSISGDLTAASYAAELTAGFINLGKAFRRAARRFQSGEVATITMTSSSHTFSLVSDVFVYILEEDASYDNGAAYPDPAAPTSHDRRIITIINDTTSPKKVGDAANQRVATLQPNEAMQFYGNPSGGGTTLWVPLGAQLNESAYDYPSLTGRLYDNGDPTAFSGTFGIRYMKSGPGKQLITLNIGGGTVTMTTASSGIAVSLNTYQVFPKHLISIGIGTGKPEFAGDSNGADGPTFPVIGSINGTQANLRAVFRSGTHDPASTYLLIEKALGGNFSIADAVTVFPFSMSYLRYRA